MNQHLRNAGSWRRLSNETRSRHSVGRAMRPYLKRLGRSDGGSLIEFALVVPMMMVIVTALFCFGVALSVYMTMTNGVSAGARAFALSRGVTITNSDGTTSQITDPCAYAVQTAQQSASVLTDSAATFQITWTPNGGTAPPPYSTTCNGIALNTGDTVTVQVSYPISMLVYGWAPSSLNMSAQTTELVQ